MLKSLAGVAAGLCAGAALTARAHAQVTELERQPTLGQRTARQQGRPGTCAQAIQAANQFVTGEKLSLGPREDVADIHDQSAHGVFDRGDGAQSGGGFPRAVRPGIADEVGQDQQRLPDVGGAVVQVRGRSGRVAVIRGAWSWMKRTHLRRSWAPSR